MSLFCANFTKEVTTIGSAVFVGLTRVRNTETQQTTLDELLLHIPWSISD